MLIRAPVAAAGPDCPDRLRPLETSRPWSPWLLGQPLRALIALRAVGTQQALETHQALNSGRLSREVSYFRRQGHRLRLIRESRRSSHVEFPFHWPCARATKG